MLSKLTLANAAGEDIVFHEDTAASRREIIKAKGLVGIGPLRESKRVRPSAHGAINETSFEDGRSIELDGEVWSTESIEKALEDFRKLSGVAMETLDGEPALLKWTEGASGLKLQMLVKLDSEMEPVLQEAAALLTYPVTFFAEDPRAYSQTQTTVVGSPLVSSKAWASLFVPTKGAPTDIALDGAHIYWVDGVTLGIGRATLAGGSVEPEWVKTTEAGISLAVDSSHIYWGTAKGKIGRAAIGGGSVENTWVAGLNTNPVTGLAVNASNLFYAQEQSATILSGFSGAVLAKNSLAGALEKQVTVQTSANALALDASHVYWASEDGFGRCSLTFTLIEPAWLTVGEPLSFTVDSGHIYWTIPSSQAIGRAAIGGGSIEPCFITGLAAEPFGLAVNAEHLFWGYQELGNSTGQVAKSISLAGSGRGSNCVVTQAGNRATPLQFKIGGTVSNPSIVRASDGARIALSGVVPSGPNLIEIDTATREARVNGLSVLGMVQGGNTNWGAFEAPPTPGSETYLLVCDSANCSLEAIYRSAYA